MSNVTKESERRERLLFPKRSPDSATGARESFRTAIHRTGREASSSVVEELRALMELGCQEFDMALALLTRVEKDQIRVLEVVGASGAFRADDVCGVRESYCGETLLSGRPLGIEHAAASEWRDHPAYRFIQMESYLGSPIRIGGEMSGTLCLLDPEPRKEPFNARDFEKLRLLVERVEAILIPEPNKHLVHFYGTHANRSRSSMPHGRDSKQNKGDSVDLSTRSSQALN